MKDHDHRGVSVGTVLMLTLTVLVLVTSAVMLPKLMGSVNIRMDGRALGSAMDLGSAVPAPALNDIPITDATPVPSLSPDVTWAQLPQTPSPSPSVSPSPTSVPGGTLTLTIGGSVTVDDGIRKSAYYSDSQKYDFAEILSLIDDEMQSDITVLTLENLTDPDSKVSALNAPEAVMDMLADSGVDLLCLGFGRAYDKGAGSLAATIAAAKDRGMTTLGAYADQSDASQLRMVTINNVDVAFLHGVNSISSTGKKGMRNDGNSYALPTTDAMASEIARARAAGADVVIVMVNWANSGFKVNNNTKKLAQALADAGADVIIGAGTASVQPLTWLTAKRADGSISQTLCAWSLGSLLNSGRKDSNVAGMLLQLQISFNGTAVSFERVCYTPTYIWYYKQDGKNHYRVVASDLPAPDGMEGDHIKYMEKALSNIQKKLKDSPVTLREK